MAVVSGEFQSDLRDEPIIIGQATSEDPFYWYHDIHTGGFVLTVRDSELEATVYRFDALDLDLEAALTKLGSLVTTENVHKRLIAWGRSEPIPYHLDSGEPGQLTIAHLPLFEVDLVRVAS